MTDCQAMTALERISGNRQTWRNWAGNQWSVPDHLLRPTADDVGQPDIIPLGKLDQNLLAF